MPFYSFCFALIALASRLKYGLLVAVAVCLLGCEQPKSNELVLAINPWPGYEMLYLAKEKGYFAEEGLDLHLVELNSLGDSQRAYMSGQVDGLTSTMVEAILIQVESAYPLQLVVPTDYSNGGDVIVAREGISKVADLKGKRVGCEVNSLGVFVLHRALQRAGLSLADVQVVNVGLAQGVGELELGVLDALVAYPPASLRALETEGVTEIFSSKQIPREILDVVSVKQSVLAERPELIVQLLAGWQKAFEFTRDNPEEAFAIMAEREQIPADRFAQIFREDVHVFSRDEALAVLRDWQHLTDQLIEVCEVLKTLQQHNRSCSQVHAMVNRGAF